MTPPSAARLVTLTAIVVALAAAVGITGGGRALVERPLIAPGLGAGDVTAIHLSRAGEPTIDITIDDAGMRVETPARGPADEATVRDLISAIATARADRVLTGAKARASAGLDASTLRVRIERRGQPPLEIVRGTAVPASGQVWFGVGDRAFLVPAWVGAALDRDLLSLRRRQVFPPVVITGVEIHSMVGFDLVLSGTPLRRRDEGVSVRVSRWAVAELDAALAAAVLDVMVPGDSLISTVLPRLTVRVLGGAEPHELWVHGPCPGHLTHALVSGSAGVGCLDGAVIDRIRLAAETLSSDPLVVGFDVETALAPAGAAEVESIRSSAGTGDVVLARRGAGWTLTLGGEPTDADDDEVNDFFTALAERGKLAPLPTGAPTATWSVTLTGGDVETWRWYERGGDRGPIVRRNEEPRALEMRHATGVAMRRLGPRLRNKTLLVIDASMVNAIRATGVHPATVVRGQLVGDWTVQSPAGTTATPAVQKLADMLATFRGYRWLDERDLGAIRRKVTFDIDAPPIPGEKATTHTFAIGAERTGGGCAARVDAFLPIELAPAQCADLLAPLAQP